MVIFRSVPHVMLCTPQYVCVCRLRASAICLRLGHFWSCLSLSVNPCVCAGLFYIRHSHTLGSFWQTKTSNSPYSNYALDAPKTSTRTENISLSCGNMKLSPLPVPRNSPHHSDTMGSTSFTHVNCTHFHVQRMTHVPVPFRCIQQMLVMITNMNQSNGQLVNLSGNDAFATTNGP